MSGTWGMQENGAENEEPIERREEVLGGVTRQRTNDHLEQGQFLFRHSFYLFINLNILCTTVSNIVINIVIIFI